MKQTADADYLLIDPDIRFQIHCRVVRMQSQRGRTNLPRHWITLESETIWDYPGQFATPGGNKSRAGSTFTRGYPYSTDIPEVVDRIRDEVVGC